MTCVEDCTNPDQCGNLRHASPSLTSPFSGGTYNKAGGNGSLAPLSTQEVTVQTALGALRMLLFG